MYLFFVRIFTSIYRSFIFLGAKTVYRIGSLIILTTKNIGGTRCKFEGVSNLLDYVHIKIREVILISLNFKYILLYL